MELSIIIVNWNTRELLRNCLQSVFAQMHTESFEVIVVDNGSEDGSSEMIFDHFPEVRLICNGKNRGFACANNDGLRLAQGKYILLLNSDTIVLDAAIDKVLSFLDSHPKVGVAGCQVLFPDGSFQSSYYKMHRLLDLFMIRLLPFDLVANNRLNRSRYWGRIFSHPREVEVVAGCFFLIRKQVVEEVGMLDEDFFMFGEEEEWCFRVQKKGWKILYYPYAKIIHLHGVSSKKAGKVMNLIARKSPLLVLEKTRGFLIAWLGNLILMLGALIRFPLWLCNDVIKGKTRKIIFSLLHGRIKVLRFHVTGLIKPVWRN